MSDSDSEAGRRFDDAVRSTGVIGEITTGLSNVQADVTEIKGDVKAMRSTMDRWGGAVAMMSALISVAVSIAVTVFKLHP